MFDFLRTQFDLEEESEIKLSDRTYKIKTSKGTYIVKEVPDDTLNRLYTRLLLIRNSAFQIPSRGRNGLFVQEEKDKFYILSPFLKDEALLGYDLRIAFYLRSLAELHSATFISLTASDHYLESTLNYLDAQIKRVSDAIEARQEVVERSDYHSPNDWYFMMHFHSFQEALETASRHVLNLENAVKEQKGLRLCLTYQNFDFQHILLKQEKIVSLEKMGYNFASYDLFDFISKVKITSMNLTPFIEEYLKINELRDYEKEYLMEMLYLLPYHRLESQKEDLAHLIGLSEYLEKVNALESEVIFSSPSSE